MAEIPPLDVSETSMAGADVALRACIARDAPPLDERPEVKAQAELLAAMSALARRIETPSDDSSTTPPSGYAPCTPRRRRKHATNSTTGLKTMNRRREHDAAGL